ncbi:hypothetical protein GCM10007094_43920 [Pseudovibrio japonicus]|uniref:Uncharacterized protein n=2 Tax=Pseudovibrio japonicus TaxID=366534 RepID=A0ABQ3ETW2_9HYPH|nr:hypothetical protein GCM10007094_43920 [Pseudovibrio japonicus]
MGIHLAFHTNPVNNLLHIVMPPFNTLGVLLCLFPIGVPAISIGGVDMNMALIALLGTFLVYALLDVLAAVLTLAPVVLLYPLCFWIYELVGNSAVLMVVIGASLFFAALWIQVGIGHKFFEEGIGDEDENIGEVYDTFNPIYFTLLPMYSILDILFHLGYRKKTASEIRGVAQELRPLVLERKKLNPMGKGI